MEFRTAENVNKLGGIIGPNGEGPDDPIYEPPIGTRTVVK